MKSEDDLKKMSVKDLRAIASAIGIDAAAMKKGEVLEALLSAGTPEQGMQPKSLEQLARTVAAMLSREYGVTDPEQLKSLTIEALKTIKNNI